MSTGIDVPVTVSKPWYLSKTVWVNMLTAVVGVVGYLAGTDFVSANPAIVAALFSAAGVLNVILRLVSSKPIV